MYLAVDIGGTKTLVATISDDGAIQDSRRFPTTKDYRKFLGELEKNFQQLGSGDDDLIAAGVAVPGRLDRDRTKVLRLGNLPWEERPIKTDCEKILNCPVAIENDANLAALSESMLHKGYKTVLYITISTGIGTGVVSDQKLDPALLDSEGGQVLLLHDDKLVRWEKFASGKAIYEHFGKKVKDVPSEDEASWRYIARNLALGLWQNLTIIQPDLMIIGGGVGTYFDKFETQLHEELDAYKDVASYVRFPEIVKAERPEEAVIFGCYDLAKQEFGHGKAA